MNDDSESRPRPTPRARPGSPARPSPRPRVAGSRRDRDDAGPVEGDAAPTEVPSKAPDATGAGHGPARPRARRGTAPSSVGGGRLPDAAAGTTATARRGVPALALALALLCLVAGAGVGLLLWERMNPTSVNPEVFAAARSGVEALYGYDYEDSEGSIQRKLDATTGELREQQEQTWQGAIIDQYEQASAKGRYEVTDVGLQRVNEAQDTATLVVFGQLVVESVNAGTQAAPDGSECRAETGASTCIYTLRVTVVQVDGDWKLSEAVILTTS